MKKRLCSLLILMGLVISSGCASAEAAVQYTGQIHPDLPMLTLTVDDAYVNEHLAKLTGDRNLKKYVL